MRRSPPKSTIADIPRPVRPEPNAAVKERPPAVVVQCWCGLVERMDRRSLDRFTRPSSAGHDVVSRGRRSRQVKEAMGHADLRTTMGYTHLAREHLKDLVVAQPEKKPGEAAS